MSSCWVIFLFISAFLCWIPTFSVVVRLSDVPEVTCSGCGSFPNSADSRFGGVTNYSFVFNLENRTVLIGAKNYLFIFSPDGRLEEHLQMNSTTKAFADCLTTHLNRLEHCYNIINFIIPNGNGTVIVCGTNSALPYCWNFNGTHLEKFKRRVYYYPRQKSVHLKADGYVFNAFTNENNEVQLQKSSATDLENDAKRIMRYDTYPKIEAMYELGDYIYYFFTELPEEIYDKGSKVTYSRVARLCKYDTSLNSERALFMFSKARLLCSKLSETEEELPTHYDVLEGTWVVKTSDGRVYIYGVFTTNHPGARDSAICRFLLSDIDKLFKTSKYYKYGKPSEAAMTVVRLPGKDPRLAQCNRALANKKYTFEQRGEFLLTSLAVDVVKPDGASPLGEFPNTRLKRIFVEIIPTSDGKDSLHLLTVIDPTTVYDMFVPEKSPSKLYVFSRRKISEEPLDITKINKIKATLFVAAEQTVAIVPEESCHTYKTCWECVKARNPFCGWHLNECRKYNPSNSSLYKQDIVRGITSICDPVPVSCQLSRIGRLCPGLPIRFSCKYRGLPIPDNITWSRDGTTLNPESNETILNAEFCEAQLVIRNYTLDVAGNYTCNVHNGLASSSCSYVIPGSVPRLQCSVANGDSWWLSYNVTGYPEPTVVLDQSGTLQSSDRGMAVKIEPGQSYHYMAYNPFGMASAKTYKLSSKSVTLKLKIPWKEEYGNSESQEYSDLKSTLTKSVKELYIDKFFVDISGVSFRRGSCIASFEVSGVTTSSAEEKELTRPIQDVLEGDGKLGSFNVANVDEPKPTPDAQSTSTRLTTASTTPLPTPPRPSSSTKPHHSSSVQHPPENRSSSSSSGVPAWAIVVVVLFCGAVFFAVGYICGVKGLVCKWRKGGSPGGSVSEDKEEMEEFTRAVNVRESRKKLLDSHDGGKRRNPSNKSATSPDKSSDVCKRVSLEISPDGPGEKRPEAGMKAC